MMSHSEKLVTIYWRCDEMVKAQILRRFRIPKYTTVNGETPAMVGDEALRGLMVCADRHLIDIRPGNQRLYRNQLILSGHGTTEETDRYDQETP